MLNSSCDSGRGVAISEGCRQIGYVRVVNPASRDIAAHPLLQLVLGGKSVECGLQKLALSIMAR